jgi:hypothetical protein
MRKTVVTVRFPGTRIGSGSSIGDLLNGHFPSRMVTLVVSCSHCQSPELVRNGAATDGRQRYLCRACGRRSTANPRPNGYTAEQRELLLRA